MIKIAICDDDKYQLEQTYNLILDISRKNNILIDIHTFNSSKNLMTFLYDDFSFFEIFFLDIIMDDINGIELGRFIRKNNESCEIILTTTSSDYMLDGYSIDASNYLLKPLSYDSVENQFLKSINNINKNSENFIVIKSGASLKKVNLSDIIFFESKLRKIVLYTLSGEVIEFYDKLDSIYEQIINKGFTRSHKSYVVNLKYIKEIEGNSITMSNESIIPISRAFLKSTKDSFLDFFMNSI